MEPSGKLKRELKETYEKLRGKPMTDREVFEIATNLLGFFELLAHFDEEESKK